jgi:hypothetical protein
MDDDGFDRIPLRSRRPERGSHRLAGIGLLVAASPLEIAALGYAVTPDGDGFQRLGGLVWGTVAAAPASVVTIVLGVLALRRRSPLGVVTILAGFPGLLALPSLVQTLSSSS